MRVCAPEWALIVKKLASDGVGELGGKILVNRRYLFSDIQFDVRIGCHLDVEQMESCPHPVIEICLRTAYAFAPNDLSTCAGMLKVDQEIHLLAGGI